jgi:hypothetical protein
LKTFILMALAKAEKLDDEALAQQIAELESGRRKLRLRDEFGRRVLLSPLFLTVFRRVQEDRKKQHLRASA